MTNMGKQKYRCPFCTKNITSFFGHYDRHHENLDRLYYIFIDEIIYLNKVLDRVPTARDAQKYSVINYGKIIIGFGGWKPALKEAGLKPPGNGPKCKEDGGRKGYDKKDIKEEFYRLYNQKKKIPTIDDFRDKAKMSITTVRYYFGSWSNFVENCGYTPRRRSEHTEEKILSEIKDLYDSLERIPTIKEFYRQTGISNTSFYNSFDTWYEAFEKLGLEDEYEKRVVDGRTKHYSEEFILSEVESLYDKIEEIPTTEDIDKKSQISSSCIYGRYGGLQELYEKIDRIPDGDYRPMPSGENHHNWKGGYDRYYGNSWFSNRKKVRGRDGLVCRICEGNNQSRKNRNPDVHHITPVRYWDVEEEHEEMNHPRNLISLCSSCHVKLENKFKGRNHRDFEMLAREYLDIEEKPTSKQSLFDY